MIRILILDVDGVLIGERRGFNSPWPHPDVITTLKKIQQKNIPIILCTAKPYWAVEKIIKDAALNNLHVAEGGAVITNLLDGHVFEKHTIDQKIVEALLAECLAHQIYVEFYTVDQYFIQKDQTSTITEKHAFVLQRDPQRVDSIVKEAKNQKVVKVMPVAKNLEDKKRIQVVLKSFESQVTIGWGVHPVILPLQFGILTANGVSKKEAASNILKYYNLSFDHALGVGDSLSDWTFIEPCGYKAVMGNAAAELKKLASQSTNSYIGGSVDENGILDILNHFHTKKSFCN